MHRSRRIGLSALSKHAKLITFVSLPTGHSEAFTLGAVGVCAGPVLSVLLPESGGALCHAKKPHCKQTSSWCGLRLLTTCAHKISLRVLIGRSKAARA